MELSFRLENRFLRREASKLIVRLLKKMKPTFMPTFPSCMWCVHMHHQP